MAVVSLWTPLVAIGLLLWQPAGQAFSPSPHCPLLRDDSSLTSSSNNMKVSQHVSLLLLAAFKSDSRGEEEEEEELNLEAFQAARDRQESAATTDDNDNDDEVFDGYALRDVILEKWGECFDADFQRVETFGMREIYLNILPFRLGSKRFRHESEMDYLCHLQAIVEILDKYDQIGNILFQIDQTNKKPRAGTSPLLAVPLRLDLTPEEVNSILGYED